MADKTLVNYINQYKAQYSVDQLRQQLIRQGYSTAQVDEAVNEVMSPPRFSQEVPAYDDSSQGSLDDNTGRILSALSYPVWIVAIITIIMAKKENQYARYHGFQGLFWGIGFLVVSWLLNWVFRVVFMSSLGLGGLLFGGLLGSGLSSLIWLAGIILSVLFAVRAYKGQTFTIPLITNLMKAIVKDL